MARPRQDLPSILQLTHSFPTQQQQVGLRSSTTNPSAAFSAKKSRVTEEEEEEEEDDDEDMNDDDEDEDMQDVDDEYEEGVLPSASTSSYSLLPEAPLVRSSLPHNPLASIVHTNLKQLLEEEEEEEDEDEDEEDAEAEDEPIDTSIEAVMAAAAAASAAQSAESSSAAAAAATPNKASKSTPSKSKTLAKASLSTAKKPARKKRAAELLADDSLELEEILGSGFGKGAENSTPKGRAAMKRGQLMVMRKGSQPGKFSKLTPELEKKMGEANGAYLDQQFAKAVDILLHIIQAAPHAQGPYHTLGLIYEERGEMNKAIEAMLLAAHMSKRDWDLWKRIANLAHKHQLWTHAIYCWTKILSSEPDNLQMRGDRACAYFEIKEFRKALDGFQYLLKKMPHDVNCLRQAASAYSHLNRPQSGVNLLVNYVNWFKATIEKNEALEREKDKQTLLDPTAAAAAADNSLFSSKKRSRFDVGFNEDAEAEDEETEEEKEASLKRSDIDINLINILCELYLSLRKYQELVDTIEDLAPYLRASCLANNIAQAGQMSVDEIELPFDLNSKLGIAYLHLKEIQLADAIFAPVLQQPPVYDVDDFGDLYVDIAEAYVANKVFAPAQRLSEAVLRSSSWNEIKPRANLLLAKCLHARAIESLPGLPARVISSAATPATSSVPSDTNNDSSTAAAAMDTTASDAPRNAPMQLPEATRAVFQQALQIFESVNIAEEGHNIEVRVALLEIYQVLGEFDKAKEVLHDIEPLYEEYLQAGGKPFDALSNTQPGIAAAAIVLSSTARAPRSNQSSMSSATVKHLEEMRAFAASLEEYMNSAGEEAADKFLQLALPTIVNIISTAILIRDDDSELMPHRMDVPSVKSESQVTTQPHNESSDSNAASDAGATPGDATINISPSLPVDSAHSFTAQRSILTIEFLRPAIHCIKLLFASGRHSESLWIIYHVEYMLTRYSHSHPTSSSGSSTTTTAASSAIAQPGATAASASLALVSTQSFSEQVRLIILGLKYISVGIFLQLQDAERAYQAIRTPLQINPYSFPLAYTMNRILNAQQYPGKAIRTLERLFVKHPDSLPLRMLLGHGCLAHQNYEGALTHYAFIHTKLPRDSVTLLLIGVTQMQISLKKLNVQRHRDLMIAFSFLLKYVKVRKAEAQSLNEPPARASRIQEAHYNLGRAFHYVGLYYLAIPQYKKVLNLAADIPAFDKQQKRNKKQSQKSNSTVVYSSLHMEAAHNLAVIYSQSGSPDLARELYAQYSRI